MRTVVSRYTQVVVNDSLLRESEEMRGLGRRLLRLRAIRCRIVYTILYTQCQSKRLCQQLRRRPRCMDHRLLLAAGLTTGGRPVLYHMRPMRSHC